MGIRSLARELGLSIGTVSRALNDRPDVNEATRARVKAAASAFGYVPNQSGRSLRKGCTGIVAAVIPTTGFSPASEAIFFRVLEGLRRKLLQAGIDLIVLFRGPDEDLLENLKRIASRRIADGIVITQTSPRDPRIPFLKEAAVEFVAFGRSEGCDGCAWVDFDFETSVAEAVRLLAQDGHRRFALVTNGQNLNYNLLLERSFRAAVAGCGLPPGAAAMAPTLDSRLAPHDRRVLLADDGAPTAFLACNESIAAALYADLAGADRPVGSATALICMLPATAPEAFDPPLSHVAIDLEAVGLAIADQLLAVLPGVPPSPAPPLAPAPGTLVLRSSHRARGLATA